jgi:hypothetical protein
MQSTHHVPLIPNFEVNALANFLHRLYISLKDTLVGFHLVNRLLFFYDDKRCFHIQE